LFYLNESLYYGIINSYLNDKKQVIVMVIKTVNEDHTSLQGIESIANPQPTEQAEEATSAPETERPISNLTSIFSLQAKAEKSSPELVDLLMKYGRDSTIHPLIQAMEENDVNAVKILIKHGVDINVRTPRRVSINGRPVRYKNEDSVLDIAIDRSDKKLIKYFIEKGADPTSFRHVRYRIENGKVVIGPGHISNSIFETIRLGRLDILEIIIDHGVDLNQVCVKYFNTNNTSLTPIQAALLFENSEIVKFLLDKGAKI
jgi:ankyrin repeat protein